MAGKNNITAQQVAQDISQLWNGLPQEQLDILKKHIEIIKFKKNDFIYQTSEAPTKVMCLIQGKVKICKDGINGRSQIIRAIKPIEFFAFRAFFADEPYKTSAQAIEASTIASIPAKVLLELMKTNFNIGFFFIKYLSTEIGKSDDRTVSLTQKHIRGRLAEALLYLKESYGTEEDGQTLSSHMSREELANLSNMTTSNAIRTLSSFAADNLIAIDGRKIKILEEEELKKISEEG